MRKKLFLSLFASALLFSCVSIPNTRVVTVAGQLSAGGIWAETQTLATGDLSFDELLDFIEPQAERVCVPVPGFPICQDDQTHGVTVHLPARGGAVMQSSEDYGKQKTALEEACRELGSRCSYEVQQAIAQMNTSLVRSK